jgi:hypothetical protein
MFKIEGEFEYRNCAGLSRRSFLQAGFLGFAGLALSDLLRLKAEAAEKGRPTKNKSVILIWLDGGPSHLETYDPKPGAPPEYRGPFGAIKTNVPGILLCEKLEQHAKHADKMAFIRSVHHDNGDHFAAAHWMTTGYFGSNAANLPQQYPSVGSIVAKVKGPNKPEMPAYVGLPAAETIYLFPGYMGSAYLGPAYNPFDGDPDHKYIGATSNAKIGTHPIFKSNTARTRLAHRVSVLEKYDQFRREVEKNESLAASDQYTQKAAQILLNPNVRKAFDLDAESPKIAERYGTSPWGRYALLARRLVENGVTFVTVDMPHWDDHANIKENIEPKLVALDRAVSGLMQDLSERGMLEDVLVVVMGEFGRTPRLNNGLPGDSRPGRDHWGNAISVVMAGGGLRGGQVVGATNERGEHPTDRPLTPPDILATMYHVLGIDPKEEFPNHEGRPIAILRTGEPIRELI